MSTTMSQPIEIGISDEEVDDCGPTETWNGGISPFELFCT